MFGSSHTPKTPNFVPPPAYTPPQPFVSAGDPNQIIPGVMNPKQIMNQGKSVESQLPSWMQLFNNPQSPAGLSAYQNSYYQQNVAPAIAQMQAALSNGGQGSSTFGGAALGQEAATGAQQSYNAGLNYQQQQYQNQLAGRSSYFQGGPLLAQQQNAANVARGESVYSGLLGNAGMQNNYDLSSAGMQNNYGLSATGMQNNFDLSNYENQLKAYQLQQQQAFNQTMGLGGLGLGIAKLGGGAIGSMMGGGGLGGGGFSSPNLSNFSPTFGQQYGFGGTLGGLPTNSVGGFGSPAGETMPIV